MTSRKSDRTKAAILDAARERFAADGYERATIRAIAADADIDPAMVMRYFGSKEGLFAASTEPDLRLPDLTAVPRRRLGVTLTQHFLAIWEEGDTLPALLRAAATNPTVTERARSIFVNQVRQAIAPVVSDPDETTTRAALVGTQILGMAYGRYVLRLPVLVDMSRADVVSWIAPTIQRYLTGPAPA